MTNSTEENIKVKKKTNSKAPSPLGERICKCGCGHVFIPNRRDKFHINSQHANFGYNHGARKEKLGNEIEIQKKLHLNDKILEKHYLAGNKKEVLCFLSIILAEGFSLNYYVGLAEITGIKYFYLYNYIYTIGIAQGQKTIKIIKQS